MKIVYATYGSNYGHPAYKKTEKESTSLNGAALGLNQNAWNSNNRDKWREQQNEMKIRENEDKLIGKLREQITEVNETPMDKRLKESKITSLTDKIDAIYEARAQRAQEAAQREVEEQQAELAKKKQEAEEKRSKTENPAESTEDALRREDINGMAEVSQSYNSLRTMKRTKSTMAAEASRLQQDIDNSFGFMQFGLDTTVRVKSGRTTPNDFRNRHLAKLEKGVAGLESTANARMVSLYKRVSAWSENKKNILERASAESKTTEADAVKTTSTEEANKKPPQTAEASEEKSKEQNDRPEDKAAENLDISI